MTDMEKRQVEDFVELLGRVHDQIGKSIEDKDILAASELLEECQNGAVVLGNYLEHEGSCIAAVPLLEEYCEQLYQAYKKLGEDKRVYAEEVERLLYMPHLKIVQSIRGI